MNKAPLQPKFSTRKSNSGGTANWPVDIPTNETPVAKTRRRLKYTPRISIAGAYAKATPIATGKMNSIYNVNVTAAKVTSFHSWVLANWFENFYTIKSRIYNKFTSWYDRFRNPKTCSIIIIISFISTINVVLILALSENKYPGYVNVT